MAFNTSIEKYAVSDIGYHCLWCVQRSPRTRAARPTSPCSAASAASTRCSDMTRSSRGSPPCRARSGDCNSATSVLLVIWPAAEHGSHIKLPTHIILLRRRTFTGMHWHQTWRLAAGVEIFIIIFHSNTDTRLYCV